MLSHIDINKILFLDIETVPGVYRFDELSTEMRELWSHKTRFLQERDGLKPDEIYERAGIYAEFGKIICVSTAFEYKKDGVSKLRVKSFYSDDEKTLLMEFGDMLIKHFNGDDTFLCGHNVKEFDAPYLARRMVLHGLELPKMFEYSRKKALGSQSFRHYGALEIRRL